MLNVVIALQVKTSSPIAPCGEHLGPCPPEATASSKGDREEGLPIYNVNNTAAYDKALSEQALLDADAGSRYGFSSGAFELLKVDLLDL